MITPHHIDHPQPTKQNKTQKSCETPTIKLIINDPNRSRAPSWTENLGLPKHKQSNPLITVPKDKYKIFQFALLFIKCCKICATRNRS